MTRFLAFGDAHFGAGSEYGREPGDRLADQEQSLNWLVDLAADHGVDAVLFAGDAFDGPIVTPEQYEAFRRPLRRLRGLGIPCVGVSGNGRHDSAMRVVNALEIVDDVMQVHRAPAVVELCGVHLGLLPWASNRQLVALRDGGDRDLLNSELGVLLLSIARGLFDQIPAGAPSLLLGHWSLTGAHLPNGMPVDDLREPVIETGDLEAIGFDFNVFGHIHVPGPVGERTLYTGPLTTTSFGEAAHTHGCWLIDVDVSDGETAATFLPIDERPFLTIDLDAEDLADIMGDPTARPFVRDDGHFMGHAVEDAVVRVRYEATEDLARRIDHANIRQALIDAGAWRVYAIQPTILRSARARVEGVDEDLAPMQALELWAEANALTATQFQDLADLTGRYLQAAA